MTYEQITQKATNALGIPYEKFILDFNQINLIEDGTGQAESKLVPLKWWVNDIKYKYINCWSNHWKGVVFYIHKSKEEKFIIDLNVVLAELNEKIIDIETSKKEYYYLDGNFAVLSVFSTDEFLELHFAKSDLNT